MNRRKQAIKHGALLMMTATIVGCRHQINTEQVQLMTVDPNRETSVYRTQEGDILEWHLPAKSGNHAFYVHFFGYGPCDPKDKPVRGENGVARCTVAKPPTGPVSYQYYIDNSEQDSDSKEGFQVGPRSCGGCVVHTGTLSTSPADHPYTNNSKEKHADNNATIYCDRKDGLLKVSGGTDPNPKLYWERNSSVKEDWSITFDLPQGSPCAEKGPFNEGNENCTISQPRTQPYTYTITASNCKQNKVTIPKSQ